MDTDIKGGQAKVGSGSLPPSVCARVPLNIVSVDQADSVSMDVDPEDASVHTVACRAPLPWQLCGAGDAVAA